jgi:hypothetical protein
MIEIATDETKWIPKKLNEMALLHVKWEKGVVGNRSRSQVRTQSPWMGTRDQRVLYPSFSRHVSLSSGDF